MMRHAGYQAGFSTMGFVLLLALSACSLLPAQALTSVPQSASPTSTFVIPATQSAIPKIWTRSAVPKPSPVVTAAPSATALAYVPSTSLRMVDLHFGWGVGEGRVLRTVNGGQTWEDITPKDMPSGSSVYPQVVGIDAQSAWVLIQDSKDYNHGTLYRTSDGGQNWEAAAVPFGGGFIQLLDAKTGWVLADRGAAAGSMAVDLFHTNNGGTTWILDYAIDPQKPENSSLPFSGGKTGMTFRDSMHGWVVGIVPVEGITYLYATEDGGKNWKAIQLSLPAGLKKSQTSLEVPQFFDDKSAILPVHLYNGGPIVTIYVSRDGGANWLATQPVNSYGPVTAPTKNDFIIWDGGTLHFSHDAGQSWKELTPNINLNQKIGSLQFINPMTGWALSYDGNTSQLYRTSDGGQTWERLSK